VSEHAGTPECRTCAWAVPRGPGPRVLRCLRHVESRDSWGGGGPPQRPPKPAARAARAPRVGRRITAESTPCASFTPRGTLDCQACGACCREAYHRVEVAPQDPFARTHAALLETVHEDGRPLRVLARPGGRCRCLGGEPGAWACTAYADRPRTCRDFPVGGESCLEARRRVGLTA